MASCGKSSILDAASSGSVIEQHSCAEFPMQSIPVQQSCPVVTCNALDSNVEHSNTMEVHTGSASTIDVTEMSRDSSSMVNKNENTDRLQCSCTKVTCNAVDFNVEHSNKIEGCMNFSGEIHTGSSSSIDVPEMSRDSLLMANKSENTESLQRSCPVVTSDALNSNVEHSNTMEGCMNSSREVHTGSASPVDVTKVPKDSSLMVNKNENIDMLQQSCPVVSCNVLDSNVDNSNTTESCMNFSREVLTGSAVSIDVQETSRDSMLMVNKNENTGILQQSCPAVISSVLDSDVDHSNVMESCINLSREVNTGFAGSIDVQEMSRDSMLMANKNENTGILQQSCPAVIASVLDSDVECSNMMEGCMNSSRGVHSGSASPIYASDITRNSLLENKTGNSDIAQQPCLGATCNALDSNVEHCNLMEGCMNSTREGASSIDAPEVTRDSMLMNKSENTDMLQQSCPVVTSNALDSNVEHSNTMEGCMNSSREVHTGPTGPIDFPEMSEDSLLTVNRSENTEISLLEKISKNDSQTCPSIICAQIEVSNLESVQLVSEGKPYAKDGLKMPSDFVLTSGSPVVYCHQQSEQEDTVRNANPVLEGVNESDLNCGIEADACKQTHSQGSEVAADVIYTEAEAISDQLHDQKDGSDENSHFEYLVDKESIIDTHVQEFSSPGHQRILGSLPVAYSPGEATHSERGIDNIDTDFDAEDVVKVKGKNNDVMTETNVEMKNNMPQDDNACKLNDSSSKTDANFTLRKTFPHESDLPSGDYISIISPKDVPDLLKEVNGSISYSSLVGDSGEADCIRKDIIHVDCFSESNYSGNTSLPIRRNSRRNKSGHKTHTRRALRKCKNKTSVPLLGGDMKIILEAARKKRSCFSKPARSSIWGLVGNINKFFEQDNEFGVGEVMCQGLGRVRGARKSGKRNKSGAISSSLNSMKKCFASTTRVRLKITLGKEVHLSCSDVLVPEFMNGSCSSSNVGPGPGSQERNSDAGDKCSEEVAVGKSESLTNNLDEDALVLNGQMANHHLEAAATTEKPDEVTEEVCHMIPPERMIEPLKETVNDKGMDPGTSPDSEVINSIPEVQVGERHQQGVQDAILDSSKVSDSLGGVSNCRRRKNKDKLTSSCSSIVEDGSQGPPRKNKTKHSKNRGRKKNSNDVVCSMSSHTSTGINAVSYSVSHKELSSESLPPSGEIELEDSTEALKVKSGMEVETTCSPNDNCELLESHGIGNLLSSARSSGRKLPKSLTSCKIITPKPKSKASDSMSRKKTGSRRREKQLPIKKSEVKGKAVSEKVLSEAEDCLHAEHVDGSYKLDDTGKIASDNKVSVNGSNSDMAVGTGLEEQHPAPHNAWARCDDCHKWRRIPVELADLIEETKCTWTCKDSNEKAFSDCSIPQEKSNAEINTELGLSDASGEEDAYEGCKNYRKLEYQHPTVHQESTFTHILTNEFLHRSRKNQTIDEIMVCHCKQPSEGRFGCGDECLNRMLNIECVQGACPCGDLCSNQQFQQRKYASLTWFKCGRKGYGLKAIEDISKGKFLIEYVGEVLDTHAYEARQREYAFKGHRHFYFMTLNGSEVIDASAKGNLGRFINHSCDPNCRTEKWMVNGEICIGLFAMRDIKQGEEVTFDYNYVRVFGAAAKKCYCGSPLCRGYIGGGDPHNAEVIVQGDSDEEFPEPVMLTEDGEIEGSIPRSDFMQADNLSKDRDLVDKSRSAPVPGNNQEKENSANPSPAISLLHCPLDEEDSMGKLPSSVVEEISKQMEDVISKSELPDNISSIQRMEASAGPISRVISDFIKKKRESKPEIVEDSPGFPKTHLLVKTSRANGSVKKGKVHANHSNGLKAAVTANRLQATLIKPKKVVEGSSNGRFEAVQEKLKELLDEDGEGGISKRKDATKGYLKLLLLTVASDDRNNGEAIQSNRDLSMILGALLKTKSRAVLNDIINKNGLQMLHNIMKQYRRDFKKTPILRKLLKVLEYLAASKILTFEHINGGPPCHGMESFRESMLSLTEHDDKQVHQIARSFRDRWIRRPFRRHGYVDRDDFKGESHRNFNCNRFSASQNHRREPDVRPTEAIDCAQQSKLMTTSVDAGAQEGHSAPSSDGRKVDGTKRRKRKSRWDQPAETISILSSSPCKKQNVDSGLSMHADAAIDSFDGSQNVSEDFPPGFSCPVQPQFGSSNASPHPVDLALQNVGNSGCAPGTVIGHPKEKFNSRMPVSYGMPLSFVQQFGTRAEISGSWITAPGVPFSPFPPLPPYPWDNKDCQPSSSTNAAAVDQPVEVQQRDMSGPVGCYSDDITPSTTDTSPKDIDLPYEDDQQLYKRLKGSSCDLGRKYFRQQKWNNSKIHRPWFRRNAWGSSGNYTVGGNCSISVGDEPNESKVAYSSEDVICRAEEGDNNV